MARRPPADDAALFDLPLERPAPPRPPERSEAAPTAQAALPLESPPSPEAAAAATAPPAAAATATAPTVTLRLRSAAGLTDLGTCGAVMVTLFFALQAMGVQPRLADWPAAVLFLIAFSFLYHVLPLAFWGRTPGMALAGLRARARDGQPLTFRQTVLRWLGSWLTAALAGLPWLLAPAGRSLSERLSGTITELRPARRR